MHRIPMASLAAFGRKNQKSGQKLSCSNKIGHHIPLQALMISCGTAQMDPNESARKARKGTFDEEILPPSAIMIVSVLTLLTKDGVI